MSAPEPGPVSRLESGPAFEPPRASKRAFVGLGANLGDVKAALRQAIQHIQRLTGVARLRHSSFYRSTPVDADGPDYLNAVVEFETTLDPMALLAALQSIERQHGRERSYQNAPRTLDLDLLLMDGISLNGPELQLPHPRLHQRAFVLVPLAELTPDLLIPGHAPLQDLIARCADQPLRRID